MSSHFTETCVFQWLDTEADENKTDLKIRSSHKNTSIVLTWHVVNNEQWKTI